eukprot:gene4463-14617_t
MLLPQTSIVLRTAGSQLAPQFLHLPSDPDDTPTYHAITAAAPDCKTDEVMRQAAMDGDEALILGLGHDKPTPPFNANRTGVIGSHAFKMLPFWNVKTMCHPDPDHCLANESKGIWELLSKAKLNPAKIVVLGTYEAKVNLRWVDVRPKEFPWFTTAANEKKADIRAKHFNEDGVFVPSIICTMNVHHLLTTPSFMKMHEHILCLGPVSKYILQALQYVLGLMLPEQEKASFKYMDCLGSLWTRIVTSSADGTTSAAASLKAAVVEGITAMELAFPTWEADYNRHSIIHVAEALQYCGPPPTFTTMVFERMWGRLAKWLINTQYPETTMMNHYHGYKMTCQDGNIGVDPTDRDVDSSLLPGFQPDTRLYRAPYMPNFGNTTCLETKSCGHIKKILKNSEYHMNMTSSNFGVRFVIIEDTVPLNLDENEDNYKWTEAMNFDSDEDILLGGKGSMTGMHLDTPMPCSTVILHNKNKSSIYMRDFTEDTFNEIVRQAEAQGGLKGVLTAGHYITIPGMWWHGAYNHEPTLSINNLEFFKGSFNLATAHGS